MTNNHSGISKNQIANLEKKIARMMAWETCNVLQIRDGIAIVEHAATYSLAVDLKDGDLVFDLNTLRYLHD